MLSDVVVLILGVLGAGVVLRYLQYKILAVEREFATKQQELSTKALEYADIPKISWSRHLDSLDKIVETIITVMLYRRYSRENLSSDDISMNDFDVAQEIEEGLSDVVNDQDKSVNVPRTNHEIKRKRDRVKKVLSDS